MGSRLDGMKGGGFLNNVDGTFLDYEFTNTFPGQEETPDQLFGVVTIQPDGASDPVQTTLRFGSAAYLAITDAHTITNPEGDAARIWDKSDGYRFLQSLEEAGVKDGGIDETDPNTLSLTGLLGKRMRFVQEPDTARMEARRKAGLNPKRVATDGSGKEYDFTRLVVETVYDGAPVSTAAKLATAPANGAKRVGASKTVAAAKARGVTSPFVKGGKPNGAAASSTSAGDVDIEAEAKLKQVLADNDGSIHRSDLTRLLTGVLLQEKNPRREVLRKRAYDPGFLAGIPGVTFDEGSQTISLDA